MRKNQKIMMKCLVFNNIKFSKKMADWKIMDKKRLLLEFAQAYFELTQTREFIIESR